MITNAASAQAQVKNTVLLQWVSKEMLSITCGRVGMTEGVSTHQSSPPHCCVTPPPET